MRQQILTSHPSQITKSTQIGNITVEQIATALGLETDHLTEALEEVYPTPSQEDLWNAKWWNPNDYLHNMILIIIT